MNKSKQIANRFKEVVLNGTWIANTNIQDQITKLTWKQAIKKVGSLNTIAALTYHINYYIAGVLNVLEGGGLEIKDEFSFNLSPIDSQKTWEDLMDNLWINAEKFAHLIELLPDHKLDDDFVNSKYGTYQRNLDGMIEHCYYHLGQISLIKKLIIDQNQHSYIKL